MNREEAIEFFTSKKMNSFSKAERVEELTELMTCNWSDTKGWDLLSEEITHEFESGIFKEKHSSNRYDEILRFKIKDQIKGLTNSYIKEYINAETVTGDAFKLETCPCCGYRSLEERYIFEICNLCWWEDDGQDNNNSDIILSGANEVTLTKARYNFLTHGIYNPERADLLEYQVEKERYYKHRIFKLLKGDTIIEEKVNWQKKST